MSYKHYFSPKHKPEITQAITITEPAIIFRLNKTYSTNLSQQEIYDITRSDWILGHRREKAEYGFAAFKGVVLQVYRIDRWDFSGKVTDVGRQRWFFEGKVATEMQDYINGNISHYFKKGDRSPTKYLNC
ncbi:MULTISPECIES: hypothetical protein [unclassified Synechocystis]|nr:MULTISPECIES: hypothetical protein [unclassified Synechocystis]